MELGKIYKIIYLDASYTYHPLNTQPEEVGEPVKNIIIGKLKRIERDYVDVTNTWVKDTNENHLGFIIPTAAIFSFSELYEE